MATWGDQTCQRFEATAVGFETGFSRLRQCCCRNRLGIICPLSKPQAHLVGFEKRQLVIVKNTKGEPDMTLYISMTVTIGFISFEYKLLD